MKARKGDLVAAFAFTAAGAGEQQADDMVSYWRLKKPTASIRRYRRDLRVDRVAIPIIAVVVRLKPA